MATSQLSQAEREALLHLLALGLYADGRLSLEEDEAINAELAGMEWESSTDRLVFLGDAFTQARQLEGDAAKDASLAECTAAFGSPEARDLAWSSLERLLGSDGVSSAEMPFLEKVRAALRA